MQKYPSRNLADALLSPTALIYNNQNSNVWTEKARIPMFGRVKPEFQCLEG